jgi:hypothetical protein
VPTQVVDVFIECYNAIREGALIRRDSPSDKEFHYQDWFKKRLEMLGLNFDTPGRNKYPDFTLVSCQSQNDG